ncbi:MAG: sulfite exporter TauE/SafE family protein [Nitrosopumilus sp. H8]|nr:MAG: sulfite exporter TauE/SafE family protein [Nitrosopumilus sp. H8]
MIDQLWLVPLGFAAGVLGSMIGLGGGIIIVPVLTFLGFPPTLAASNSLFATLSNAAASSIAYSRQKRIEYRLGIKLGLVSVPGAVIGALVSADVTPATFKILFGVVLVASVSYMLLRRRLEGGNSSMPALMVVLVVSASFFAGIISAFFGIGGGIVFVPLMVAGMGMSMRRAAPTSQLVLLFASFSGVITHSILGHPDFAQAGLLAAGAFFGGLAGSRLSAGVREKYLLLLASAAILAAAARLFADSVTPGV